MKGLALIGFVVAVEALAGRVDLAAALRRRPLAAALAGAALVWMLAFFGTFSANAFIYFQL
jgi:hypothetical protein